jgi:sugar phosphate isomerase/epimerase
MKYGAMIFGHVHANDNFGKEDNHLPIGTGIINFEKILRELNEAQYDETLTLEVFSRDREYLKISKEKIKRIWEAL